MENILILGKEHLINRGLFELLQDQYKVNISSQILEGIQKAVEICPSLILINEHMIGQKDNHLLRQFIEYECIKDVPILLITDRNHPGDIQEMMKIGIIDYIEEPFIDDFIKRRIGNYIHLYSCKRQWLQSLRLDALTALPNKRDYEHTLWQMWNCEDLVNKELSGLLINVDELENYNDMYGVQSGDQLLVIIAHAIRDILSQTENYLARYGGKQFIVLLPNCTKLVAQDLAEKIRTQVNTLEMAYTNRQVFQRITVSIGGISMVPNKIQEIQEFNYLLERYVLLAKKMGGNKVIWEYKNLEAHKVVQVNMLGEFSLIFSNKCINSSVSRSKKIWQLLAYLIIYRDKEISQQELIEVLWPDEQIAKPNYALKTLSYRLRKILEKLEAPFAKELIIMEDTYRWNMQYPCEVDLDLFEELVIEAEQIKLNKLERLKLYKKSLEMYQNGFLANMPPESWNLPLQVYYHGIYIKAIHGILSILEELSRYKEIEQVCQSAFIQEKYDEQIHCYFIKMLIHVGRYEEAQQHYKRTKALFFNDLGITSLKILERIGKNYLSQ